MLKGCFSVCTCTVWLGSHLYLIETGWEFCMRGAGGRRGGGLWPRCVHVGRGLCGGAVGVLCWRAVCGGTVGGDV